MDFPLVFLEGPWRLAMGLKALDPDRWLVLDDRFDEELRLRERFIAERPGDVHACLPEAEAGALELRDLLFRELPRLHPERYAATAEGVEDRVRARRFGRDEPPLIACGRLVQEDFCLMGRQPDGAYALVGAILCFPLHWRLHDKLGRPLGTIHAPVPGFGERLAGPADRFFASLTPERPVWRANWGLVEKPDLFQPGRREPVRLTPEDAGRKLWLRVERQTLRRLPESGLVVFGIRTFVRGLAEMTRQPRLAAAMAARIRELPEPMAVYKGIPPIAGPLLAWLDGCAAGNPGTADDAGTIGPGLDGRANEHAAVLG